MQFSLVGEHVLCIMTPQELKAMRMICQGVGFKGSTKYKDTYDLYGMIHPKFNKIEAVDVFVARSQFSVHSSNVAQVLGMKETMYIFSYALKEEMDGKDNS